MMTPRIRTFALTAHITVSVGWIGAVMAYLALVVAAMSSQDSGIVRAAWTAMELIGWYVIVPLAIAALLTGLLMSLGTPWGLFRQYWVVFSLVLTIVATVVLLLHMQTVGSVTRSMAATPGAALNGLPGELFHAGVGMLVLLVIQVLNIYKPRGLTPYGWRKQQERRTVSSAET